MNNSLFFRRLLFVGTLVLVLFAVTMVVSLPSRDQLAAPGGVSALDDTDTIQPLGSDTIVREGKEIKVHPSRVLVKFKPGATRNFHAQSGPIQQFKGDRDLYLVENPSGRSVETMLKFYGKNPNVEYAEPDFARDLIAIPNDPLWSQQWDMVKISAPQAWDTQTDASDVVVGIIDSGIDFTHPDLQQNLWTNPQDGSHGYDCVRQIPGGQDLEGHGTNAAGIIGAVANNSLGMAGINWNVKLLALKASPDDQKGTLYISGIVNCIDRAIELKKSGVNVRVLNESFGMKSAFSVTEHDAFIRASNEDILHVAAAGNDSLNTDIIPFYPAGYSDVPGLMSVMATARNDAKESFSNYGLASVDIASPDNAITTTKIGPVGSCQFCDPSGYRIVAGTSFAAPHVAGVAAALFQKNPSLTSAQGRDVILDFTSYDAVTDSDTVQSTTGGRLNFFKALNNPLVAFPKLNNAPTLTISSITVPAGDVVRLPVPTIIDPDGDTLRSTPLLIDSGPFGCLVRSWLLGSILSQLFPESVPVGDSFIAPQLATAAVVNYKISVADGRGGGAQGQSFITVLPALTHGAPPTGTLTVTPTVGPANSAITASFNGLDPEGGPVFWMPSAGWPFTSDIAYKCCLSNTTVWSSENYLFPAGVYRFRAQAIDQELNITETDSVIVRLGGAIGDPPVASATLDKTFGAVPLTTTIDLSGSSDSDGTIVEQHVRCGGSQQGKQIAPNKYTCTYVEPGPFVLNISVKDNSGYSDRIYRYVQVTPTPDLIPPTVSITLPLSGTKVSGLVQVKANASDNIAVSKVELYVDGKYENQFNLIGTDFTTNLNTVSLSNGVRTLTAKAYDPSNNTSTSVVVSITVDNIINITSPVNASMVASSIPIKAQASDAIVGVQFKLEAVNIETEDTVSPFSVNFDTTQHADGMHTLTALGRDTLGNLNASPPIKITIDNTPPVPVFESPSNGSALSGNVIIAVNASDANFYISSVEVFQDNSLLVKFGPKFTPGAWTYQWNTWLTSDGTHTLTAKAYDSLHNVGITSITVNVFNGNSDAIPPTGSITSPLSGSTISGEVTLAASASDNTGGSGVKRVEFYRDSGVLIGPSSTSPYRALWNTTTVSNGAHSFYVRVFDNANNVFTSTSITATVNNVVSDTTIPSVSITAPASGATVSGTIMVAVTATDNVGVASVTVSVDGIDLGTDTTTPYTLVWDTTTVTNGSHTLRATARDVAGNTTSASITVTVSNLGTDTTPPTTTITAPASGATVSGTVTVAVTATDPTVANQTTSGVRDVTFVIDNVILATDSTAPYSFIWDTTTVANGNHTLLATAEDNAGNSITVSITVTVSNTAPDPTPPTVTITFPLNNGTVARASSVTITANATDNIGVTQVRFYVNNTLKCTDATAPHYTCAWKVSGKPGASYQLTAQASDVAGNVGKSTPVTVRGQ